MEKRDRYEEGNGDTEEREEKGSIMIYFNNSVNGAASGFAIESSLVEELLSCAKLSIIRISCLFGDKNISKGGRGRRGGREGGREGWRKGR